MPLFDEGDPIVPFIPTDLDTYSDSGLGIEIIPSEHNAPVIPTANDLNPSLLGESGYHTPRSRRLHKSKSNGHNQSVISTPDDIRPPLLEENCHCVTLKLYRLRNRKPKSENDSRTPEWKHFSRKNAPSPLPVQIIAWNAHASQNIKGGKGVEDRQNNRDANNKNIEAILRALKQYMEKDGAGVGERFVVLLQEVTLKMLESIQDNEWVQEAFGIVPEKGKWPKDVSCGDITLVTKNLLGDVVDVKMVKDTTWIGLVVYVQMLAPGTEREIRVIAIANTRFEPRALKEQLGISKRILEGGAGFPHCVGGVIGASMNLHLTGEDLLAHRFGLGDAWGEGHRPATVGGEMLYLPSSEYIVKKAEPIGHAEILLDPDSHSRGGGFWTSGAHTTLVLSLAPDKY